MLLLWDDGRGVLNPGRTRLHRLVTSLSVASLPFHRLFSKFSFTNPEFALDQTQNTKVPKSTSGHQSGGKSPFSSSPLQAQAGSISTHRAEQKQTDGAVEDASRGPHNRVLARSPYLA